MEKLIGALAEKLPAHAGRSTVELAFRAAVDALPKSKLKDSALVKREQLIGRLLILVRQKTLKADEAAEEPQEVDKDLELHSCYQDVDTDKPRDCLRHCRSLVQDALVSLDPAARAEEALGGLVALFPPERKDWKLDISDLETLVQILTLAVAAKGLQDTVSWKRFLGFVISAVLRLDAAANGMNEVQRLGCTTALLVQEPSVARAAVRIGCSSSEYGSRDQCVRLVPILLPLLRTGFLRGGGKTHKGDLLALLSGLRFLQLATMSGLQSDKLADIRKILTTAFSRDYDATPMLPELQRIAENHARLLRRGKAMLRKLQNPAKTSSASTTVEIIEALAKELQQQELARLVGFSGLPAGDDEEIDANAAAARARGDLFFEDTSGDVPLESLLKGGSSATQDAIVQVQKRKFGNLDGVEDIDVDDAATKNPKATKAKHEVSKKSSQAE